MDYLRLCQVAEENVLVHCNAGVSVMLSTQYCNKLFDGVMVSYCRKALL